MNKYNEWELFLQEISLKFATFFVGSTRFLVANFLLTILVFHLYYQVFELDILREFESIFVQNIRFLQEISC